MAFEFHPPTSSWESSHRPTWVEVSLDAIAQNLRSIQALAAPAGVMAVVKADAYGHGAVEVSRTLLEAGATWLAVAALEEGVELRRAGITAPILIVGPASPAQAEAIIGHGITATVTEAEVAEALAAAGRRAGRAAQAHLKVDTGMGRLGVTPDESGASLASRLARLDGLELTGVYTHYSAADERDKAFSHRQTALFGRFLELAARAGVDFPWRHAANSAALIDLMPEARHNLVRVGLSLYGYYPSDEVDFSRLRPVPTMTWKSRLAFMKKVPAGTPIGYNRTHVTDRPTLVGTLPVGYADGYRRDLSSRGRVLIRGESCPVLGRVCMDHIMVDLGAVPGAVPGDEAVLMGAPSDLPGDGRAADPPSVPAEELAAACGTIVYEILTGVGRRVPRVYMRGGRPVAMRSILGSAPFGGGPA